MLRKGTNVYLFSDKDFHNPKQVYNDIEVSKNDSYNLYNTGIVIIKRGTKYDVTDVYGHYIIDGEFRNVSIDYGHINIRDWTDGVYNIPYEKILKQKYIYRRNFDGKWGLWDREKKLWAITPDWNIIRKPGKLDRVNYYLQNNTFNNNEYFFFGKGDNNDPEQWSKICIFSSMDLSSPVFEFSKQQYEDYQIPFIPVFDSIGCIAVQKNGKWGLIDLFGNVVEDFKHTKIEYSTNGYNFVRLFNGTVNGYIRYTDIPCKKISEKTIRSSKTFFINKENKKKDELKKKEQKLSSFINYATAYVQPKMTEWQKKGEFEKVADYTKRVSGENRQRKIDALTKEAEDLFIKENRENINLRSSIYLESYDSENEVFSLNSSKFGRLLLPVPISNGPAFKQGFNNATIKNEKYFIENDKIALASFDIMVGGQTYHYSNNNALNYSQYQLNPDALDLPAINIVTGSSTASMRKPKVQILSPQNGSQYQQGTVSFRINVVPGDGQQPVLYVEINGAEAVALQPVAQGAKGARAVGGKLYEVSLPTEPGKTVNLAFTARDEQNVTSETQKVKLTYVGQVRKPQLILFAVGVGDYTSGDLTKLRYAAKDARDFSATIRQSNLSDYTGLKEHLYTDRQATRSNINKGLREVLAEAQSGDVVMFYFSGHGVQDGSETYFMTVDASSEAPSDEGVNFADLKNNMRKLTERQVKVVAFMDACHAGAMVGAKGAAPKLTELDVQNVIEFYSSTTGEESAEDEKLQNGVFTAGLISGLKGAAANADGYITVNTLRTYLSDYVRNKNSRQTPVFKGVDAGDITLFHKK